MAARKNANQRKPRQVRKKPAGVTRMNKRGQTDRKLERPTQEKYGEVRFADGSVCRGQFRAGFPHGRCEYYDPEDKTTLTGTYVRGELHGLASQRDEAGRLVFRGRFEEDVRVGVAEVFDEYGGRVIGEVDAQGDQTGDGIIYVFPDGLTALVGSFEDGSFVSGRYARLLETLPPVSEAHGEAELNLPSFMLSETIPQEVWRDVSTRDTLCNQPLVPDLYEHLRVEVRRSKIKEDMDGLFARTHLKAGELCSWYNGLRCTHAEVNGRDWSLNDATMTLDQDIVLDVPAQFVPAANFSACLGHKANHLKPNNAKYDVFDHPRFGLIKAIRAVRDIAPGEEICCDYGYDGDAEDLPSWFSALPIE